MNNRSLESYVLLALVVAATAIFATTANTVQLIREFDLSGSTLVTFIGSTLAQGSSALAMVCAILLAQTWFANEGLVPKPDAALSQTLTQDGIEDPPDLAATDSV